jgi:hypothetical protein
MTSKLLAAALFGSLALAFVAAPASIDPATGTIAVKAALAKHGADDVLPDARQEPQPNDDRGGRRGR